MLIREFWPTFARNFEHMKEAMTAARIERISSIDDLERLDNLSYETPVIIMKHSTRCGISHAAVEEVESFAGVDARFPIYVLDLLNYREVSDAITEKYERPHHSPQVLIVRNGEVVNHATHFAIDHHWLVKATITLD